MFKNVGSNWVVNIVTLVVTFVVTPKITKWLGVEVNGVWTVVVNLTGYLTLLVVGVPMASVRYLTERITQWELAKKAGDEAATRDRLEAVNSTIANCVGLYLRLGLLGCLAGCVLYGIHEAVYVPVYVAKSHLADSTIADARVAFAVVVVQLIGAFMSQVPIAILAANRDFVFRNFVAIGSILLRLVLVLTVFRAYPSLLTLATIQLTLLVFDYFVSIAIIRSRHPGLRIGLRGYDRAGVRQILGFSVFVLLLQLGNKLAFSTDALIIGAFVDNISAATTFEYGKLSVLQFSEFVFAIGVVLNPTATRLKTQGNMDELRETFLKWSKIGLSVTLMGGLYLVAFGDEFLRAWVDARDFDWEGAGAIQVVFMVSHFAFLPARGIAMPILMGLGHAKRPTVAFLACAVINLLLSLALVKPFGLLGVALGTAIPDVMFAVFLLREVFGMLRVQTAEYIQYVAVKAAIGSALLLSALYLAKPLVVGKSLTGMVLAGVVYTLAFGLVWVSFVYRGDSRLDLWGMIRGRLDGRRRS